MQDPLLGIRSIEVPLAEHLASIGEVFHSDEGQDSGASTFGVQWKGWRYFVKHAPTEAAAGLERARILRSQVHHSALPRILHSFATPTGRAQVYEWVDGDNVYDHRARFYALPVRERIRVLTVIYDVHQMIADAGFVMVDFYDGCLLYDFDRRLTTLVDLDEYRPDPFRVEGDRLPGSTRFMAPEEFEPGALIDHITNVYTLGRTALVLLGDGTGNEEAWGWSTDSLEVVLQATHPDRRLRFGSVKEFVDEWLQSLGQI